MPDEPDQPIEGLNVPPAQLRRRVIRPLATPLSYLRRGAPDELIRLPTKAQTLLRFILRRSGLRSTTTADDMF